MISDAVSAELIAKISREFYASLDLDQVLEKVFQITIEATEATYSSLLLLNEKGCVTYHVVAHPHEAPVILDSHVQAIMPHGLAGWAYQHRRSILVANVVTDKRWIQSSKDEEDSGSALIIPLLHEEEVKGILALHHRQVGFFDESHQSLATTIADYAAAAISNAYLFTQLKNEHNALYALTSQIPRPVFVVDHKEQITFANQSAQQLLGLNRINTPLKTVEGGDDIKLALKNFQQEADNPGIEISWPDNRVFNLSINKIAQLGSIITLDDITYFKELDAMKSLFVETVSHDLKSPLSIIHGFATLLKMENLSGRGQNNLAGILLGVEQMQALIESLLDLARIEAGIDGDVESCDMVEIVERALTNFKLQIEDKEITLTADLPAEVAEVLGNPLRLSQVAANFISNAIKYTPKGGQVSVGVSQEGPEIWLRVSDNGPGIPREAQSKLFQKFYRAPDNHITEWVEGTGLGLSIVKAIVEGYGGRVWVESEVGLGSTFGCVLPIATVASADEDKE